MLVSILFYVFFFSLMTPETEMIVHLPLSVFIEGFVDDARSLHSRLLQSDLIPEGWTVELKQSTISGVHSHSFTLSRFFNNQLFHKFIELFFPSSRFLKCSRSSFPEMELHLTITSNCTWTLHVEIFPLKVDHTPLLHGRPNHLRSVNEVSSLLRALDDSEICRGNPDTRLIEVFKTKKGLLATLRHNNMYWFFSCRIQSYFCIS